MNAELQRSYLVIFPCNDMMVDIWSSNILRDAKNRVDACNSSAYHVAELHNSHGCEGAPTSSFREYLIWL